MHHRDVIKVVEEKYYSDLPKDLLEKKTKSGEPLIRNRIAWGKSYLKKGGYVRYPKRGMVQITDKGKYTKPLVLPGCPYRLQKVHLPTAEMAGISKSMISDRREETALHWNYRKL